MNDLISCKYLLPCGDCELKRTPCKMFQTPHICNCYSLQDQTCSIGNLIVHCSGDTTNCHYLRGVSKEGEDTNGNN